MNNFFFWLPSEEPPERIAGASLQRIFPIELSLILTKYFLAIVFAIKSQITMAHKQRWSQCVIKMKWKCREQVDSVANKNINPDLFKLLYVINNSN